MSSDSPILPLMDAHQQSGLWDMGQSGTRKVRLLIKFTYLFFGLCLVSAAAVWAFSHRSEWGLLSTCGAWVSHCVASLAA